jgi:hypothetical protein
VFDMRRDVPGIMADFSIAAADAKFGLEFQGRTEVVLMERPLVGMEVVNEWGCLRIFDTVIAEHMSGLGPVFLLDMGVIVFLVGP